MDGSKRMPAEQRGFRFQNSMDEDAKQEEGSAKRKERGERDTRLSSTRCLGKDFAHGHIEENERGGRSVRHKKAGDLKFNSKGLDLTS